MSIGIEKELDVLIVGAGPAGTMLALELAAQGFYFRVVDKAPQRSDKSRSLIVQPRSFEVMNRHGEVRKLYEKGTLTGGPMVWLNNKPVLDFEVDDVANHRDSEFGFPCLVSQVDTETYLDDCLRERYGGRVERSLEATSVIPHSSGVTVTLRDIETGAEEAVRAKYVVGADGAHSVVRKSSTNIEFAGAMYPEEFLLCDMDIEHFQLARDRYHIILKTGLLAVFPMAGGWVRIMASRSQRLGTAPTIDEVKELVRRKLPGGGQVTNVTWLTNFRLHHRIVNSYRDGRVFLIGDAAHIHSPVGGQGLNTGLQDAVNLGWKLASVVRGDRPDSLLDTFDDERRHIGENLVAKTDKIFKLTSIKNPIALYLRSWTLSWLAPYIATKEKRASFYNFVSQFGISYHNSSLVMKGPAAGRPVKAGARAPDGDVDIKGETKRFYKLLGIESYNLVLFSGAVRHSSVVEELKRVAVSFEASNIDMAHVHIVVQERVDGIPFSHRLHKTYGFSSPGFAYIRPDGYVAAIGDLEGFGDFLNWLS
ncbi:FAD binding domain-containing protein [Poronia punctata]|nr:FAD binding domain-containing protein [Poronia punctata]